MSTAPSPLPLPRGSFSFSRGAPDRYALVFGLSRELASDVRSLAQELQIGVAEPAHLHAACRALAQYPGAILLLSSGLKPWDRDVVLDHAARSRAAIVWVDRAREEEARAGQVRSELERWLLRAPRRA